MYILHGTSLKLHLARCMLQRACGKVPVARCVLQGACCKVHFARCMLQSACCKVHVARCMLQGASCREVHVEICILQGACYKVHAAMWMLQGARCMLQGAYCKVHVASSTVARSLLEGATMDRLAKAWVAWETSQGIQIINRETIRTNHLRQNGGTFTEFTNRKVGFCDCLYRRLSASAQSCSHTLSHGWCDSHQDQREAKG